jgi:uncharacterized protein YjbK
MARTLRTPEKEEAVLREIRATGNASKAISKARIGHSTWYGWIESDPDLAKAHEAAMTVGRNAKADLAEDKLHDRLMAGDTTAIIFTLKTLRREQYGERILNEISGPDGAPLVVLLNSRPDGPA